MTDSPGTPGSAPDPNQPGPSPVSPSPPGPPPTAEGPVTPGPPPGPPPPGPGGPGGPVGPAGGTNRLPLIVALAVVAVVVVGGIGFLVAGGGDDDDTDTDTASGTTTSRDDDSTTSEEADTPTTADGDGDARDVRTELGPPVRPPSGDAEYDGLARDCYEGDMQACDDLFLESPSGSDYEDYGNTCGGRLPDPQGRYCADTLFNARTLPPTGNASFDDMAEDCYEGDMQACDDLFLESPVGSDYEDYGDTCGGRMPDPAGRYCADTMLSSPTFPPSGGNASLDDMAEDCYEGDMQACDDLFLESPVGSDHEDYGNTCGGRLPDPQGRYCAQTITDPPLPT